MVLGGRLPFKLAFPHYNPGILAKSTICFTSFSVLQHNYPSLENKVSKGV
jgi:hypothetical protein